MSGSRFQGPNDFKDDPRVRSRGLDNGLRGVHGLARIEEGFRRLIRYLDDKKVIKGIRLDTFYSCVLQLAHKISRRAAWDLFTVIA